MNLYLDTSALVKLYVEEIGSKQIRIAVAQAEVVSTSLLAYVEAHCAFARKYREGELPLEVYRSIIDSFDGDWEHYYGIRVSESMVKTAAILGERNALKALDALHLASAKAIKEMAGIPITFLGADLHLIQAARAEELEAILVES